MKSMRISLAKMFIEIGDVLHSMFSGLWPGIIWALTFVAGLIAPAWPPFAAVCVLVVIDMRTGRQAARHRGEVISSKGVGQCRQRCLTCCTQSNGGPGIPGMEGTENAVVKLIVAKLQVELGFARGDGFVGESVHA